MRLPNFIGCIDRFFDGLSKYFFTGRFFWQVIVLLTMYMTLYAFRHFVNPAYYSNEIASSPFFEKQIINNMLVVAHIGFAIPALLFGPWMFHAGLREDKPHIHRRLGKLYVIGCLIGAATVFPIALANYAGFVAHLGFGMMAVIWFLTTYFGYTAAINGNYATHRRWMMRSYAMTFAFVHVNFTFHLLLPGYIIFGEEMTLQGRRAMQSMVSWMFNLFVVEFYLAATSHKGEFLGFKRWGTILTMRYNKLDRFYWGWRGKKV